MDALIGFQQDLETIQPVVVHVLAILVFLTFSIIGLLLHRVCNGIILANVSSKIILSKQVWSLFVAVEISLSLLPLWVVFLILMIILQLALIFFPYYYDYRAIKDDTKPYCIKCCLLSGFVNIGVASLFLL